MRRYLHFFYCIILFFIAFGLKAQDGPLPADALLNPKFNLPERVSVSIKIGANFFLPIITHHPTAVYDAAPLGEIVPGFNAGIGTSIAFTNKISFFTDIQYINSSARYLIPTGNFNDEYTENMIMVILPFGASYQLGSGGIKYYPLAGAGLSYLVLSDMDFKYHPFPEESGYTESGGFDITFDRNRMHFDGLIGFGFQYQVKRIFLGLEITYRHGIRNYIDTNEMESMQIYNGLSAPFTFQSTGFRTQCVLVNLVLMKTGK